MPIPQVRVQVAFGSDPDDPVQVWTDVSADVRLSDGINANRGRSDEFSNVEPGRLSLTLDNTSGAYTFGDTSPTVLPGKRIRLLVSPDGDTWLPRFDGYVDGWPMGWANVVEQPRVPITATDRLARFSRLRALRHPLAEELGTAADAGASWVLTGILYPGADLFPTEDLYPGTDLFPGIPTGEEPSTGSHLDVDTVLAGGVAHLWGLQEASGSTTAGDISGAPGRPGLTRTQYGTDGTLTFGTSGIVPEGTTCAFAPVSASNGPLLDGDLPLYVGGDFTLFAQFAWSGATGVDVVRIGAVDGTGPRVVLRATPTKVTGYLIAQDGLSREVSVTTPTREGPHWVALVVQDSAAHLYVDDEAPQTVTSPGNMGTIGGIHVGSVHSADPVQVAWVGFADHAFDATRVADLAMLATGVGSERSDERVARICRWLGVSADLVAETGLSEVAYQQATDRQALDLIAEVNAVEQGVFFPSGGGQLRQHSRAHRYNREVGYTVPAGKVGPSTQVQVDLARLVNDYAVTRPGGGSYRARDEASITAYGPATRSATLHAASDAELAYAADAWVGRYAHPAPRIPAIVLDLLTCDPGDALAALSADVGDLMEVTGLPVTTPGGTEVPLWVEGVDESISATSWTLTLATSPGGRSSAWVLDSAAYSELGLTTTVAY